jgi:hypothetical protein
VFLVELSTSTASGGLPYGHFQPTNLPPGERFCGAEGNTRSSATRPQVLSTSASSPHPAYGQKGKNEQTAIWLFHPELDRNIVETCVG